MRGQSQLAHSYVIATLTSVYSHVWLFEGAEGGMWLQQLYRELGISLLPLEGGTRSFTPSKSDNGDGRKESKKQRIV